MHLVTLSAVPRLTRTFLSAWGATSWFKWLGIPSGHKHVGNPCILRTQHVLVWWKSGGICNGFPRRNVPNQHHHVVNTWITRQYLVGQTLSYTRSTPLRCTHGYITWWCGDVWISLVKLNHMNTSTLHTRLYNVVMWCCPNWSDWT
jgi:hypothetical protein